MFAHDWNILLDFFHLLRYNTGVRDCIAGVKGAVCMKLFRFELAVFAVSAIYCTLGFYVLLRVLMERLGLFGNPLPELSLPKKIVVIAVFVLYFALIAGALLLGKRILDVWGWKERIITLLCLLAGIPASFLLIFALPL